MSPEVAREGRSGSGVIAVLLMVGVSSAVGVSLLSQNGAEVLEESYWVSQPMTGMWLAAGGSINDLAPRASNSKG